MKEDGDNSLYKIGTTRCDNVEDRIKKLEQSISEKDAIIAEKDKRIAELTDKAAAFENFAEQLTALFEVLEETANTSVGKKIGNLLSGKK